MTTNTNYELSASNMQIMELASADTAGRRRAKFVIHEIYESEDFYNDNGISWQKPYVIKNMHTVNNMFLKVEFMDAERREPGGHGFVGLVNGKPQFDAMVIGSFHSPAIENIEVNGRQTECLTAYCVIDSLTYPNFCNWIQEQIDNGSVIDSSVEIIGCVEGGDIKYANGRKEQGRVPSEYVYHASAILGIKPADQQAILLEYNQSKEKLSNDTTTVSDLKRRLCLMEQNSKHANSDTISVSELKDKIHKINNSSLMGERLINMEEKEIMGMLREILDKLSDDEPDKDEMDKDRRISELSAEIDEIRKEIDMKTKELEDLHEKHKNLERGFNETNEALTKSENNALVSALKAELAQFDDEDLENYKERIEAFNKAPEKAEINSIIADVKLSKADRIIAEQQAKNDKFEQNSRANYVSTREIYSDLNVPESSDSKSGSIF